MSGSNRRQPVRTARGSVTRPFNYYQRGFNNNTAEEDSAPIPPGFFPAITHFGDAIAALPKEVVKYITLLRETEGKAYQPDLALAELVSQIARLPDPPKAASHSQAAFMAFSLSNSVNGSTSASMVDGHGPTHDAYQIDFDAHSQQPADPHLQSRRKIFELFRGRLGESIGILDEKNMMLSSANEALHRSLGRLDSVMPFIEEEISEEARLGSKTHWALYDIQQLRKVPPSERSKVDRQSASNLLAAATVVQQEADQSRSEARREAVQAKKRTQNAVDSDFDERAVKKSTGSAKVRKAQEMAEAKQAASVQANKRRRVEKSTAPVMERTQSTATVNGRGRDTTREVPNLDPVKKSKKPLPAPISRKRNAPMSPSIASSPTRGTFATTTNNNPREYSPVPQLSRMASSRGRQNSNQSHRPSTGESRNRTISSAHVLANGKLMASKISTPDLRVAAEMTGRSMNEARAAVTDTYKNAYGERVIEEAGVSGAIVMSKDLKREDTEDVANEDGLSSIPMTQTRSRTGARPTSHNTSNSKQGTPVNAAGLVPTESELAAPMMSRSRSARAAAGVLVNNAAVVSGVVSNGISALGSSDMRPQSPSRNISPSHPLPQEDEEDDADNTLEASASEASPELLRRNGHHQPPYPLKQSQNGTSSLPHPSERRELAPPSMHQQQSTVSALSARSSSPPIGLERSPTPPPARSRPHSRQQRPIVRTAKAAAAARASSVDEVEAEAEADNTLEAQNSDPVDEEEGDGDGDGEDEPRYCFCNGPSYGDMIACDGEGCAREWFHLSCVGLARPPPGSRKWFCEECKGGAGVAGRR